jgi:hypothetical protein
MEGGECSRLAWTRLNEETHGVGPVFQWFSIYGTMLRK